MKVTTQSGGYEIVSAPGGLNHVGEYFDLNRKVLIVTDDGVPKEYAEIAAKQCKEPYIVTLPHGEKTKSAESYLKLLKVMVKNEFSRHDCAVCVGGGVMGDLTGFAASCYMRGIDFYNIPTTVLSQVDSSVGGKTAIDFEGVKNVVGTFWQPKGVLMDSSLLKTLSKRQVSEGIAEAIKIAATSDKDFFEKIEKGQLSLDEIIYRSVELKKEVVEQDEREGDLRKVLNFGHTVAHAVETQGKLLHGECVAIGMLYMCGPEARERIKKLLVRYDLPVNTDMDTDAIIEGIKHDKKRNGNSVDCVYVPEIGKFEFKKTTFEELRNILNRTEK